MITLKDHPDLLLAKKEKILSDWEAFMVSGFDYNALSSDLHAYLFDRIRRDQSDFDEKKRWYPSRLKADDLQSLAIQEVLWRTCFSDTFISLYRVMHNLMGPAAESEIEDHYLEHYPATADLDVAIALVVAKYRELIEQTWGDIRTEYIEATIEAEITRRIEEDPSLTRDGFLGAEWMISIPEEQNRITAAVQSRFAQAMARAQPQPVEHPALFGQVRTRDQLSDPSFRSVPHATGSHQRIEPRRTSRRRRGRNSSGEIRHDESSSK